MFSISPLVGFTRKVWRYQSGDQKSLFGRGDTIKLLNEKEQKGKQRSKTYYTEN